MVKPTLMNQGIMAGIGNVATEFSASGYRVAPHITVPTAREIRLVMASDDSLKEYRGKRDFRRTGEPAGGSKRSSGRPIFVIQKHARRNPTSTEPKSVLSDRTLEQIRDQEGGRQG